MNILKQQMGVLAVGGVALAGCVSRVEVRERHPVYVEPRVVVTAPAPPAVVVAAPVFPGEVVIATDEDFVEPLRAYGRWEVIPGAGRCWIPTQVEADWRPYTQGHWERTDAGWFWASDEPWGWATCHYGRWDWREGTGWFWAADAQWGPAWVSWRSGEGYVGWAPLPPAARFRPERGIEFDVKLIPARSFVFVEEKHFTEPVRRKTVIVNNTTIVNKTVNITNIKVVNKTVMDEGPSAQSIERATGRRAPVVKAMDLRKEQESRVLFKRREAPEQPKAAGLGRPEKPEPVRKVERPEPVRTEPGKKVEGPAGRQGQRPAVEGTQGTKGTEAKKGTDVKKALPGKRALPPVNRKAGGTNVVEGKVEKP